MSLNPSNAIAARANPGRTMFPNLARRREQPETTKTLDEWTAACRLVDEQVKKELEAAGIKAAHGEWLRDNREVPAAYLGALCCWGFRRAWYYWVATGPGVPPDKAEAFHKDWGTQVRVDGHCGCPSPAEWFNGFAVGHYHIDTQEGLNAFAALLRSIYTGNEP